MLPLEFVNINAQFAATCEALEFAIFQRYVLGFVQFTAVKLRRFICAGVAVGLEVTVGCGVLVEMLVAVGDGVLVAVFKGVAVDVDV